MAGVFSGRPKFDRAALLPVCALIRLESLMALRGARVYYVLALILAAMVTLLTSYLNDLRGIPMNAAGLISDLGSSMFSIFGYGLYAAGLLLAPPIAAATLCNDKQQERLDLVRMTYVNPVALLFGKFVNICGLYVLVVIAALPIAGVMLFFTGVSPAQYLQLFLLVFLSVGSATALGLLFSAWFYRPVVAMLLTYIAVLFTQAGLAAALGLGVRLMYSGMAGLGLTQVAWLEPLAAALCPAYGIGEIKTATLHGSFYVIAPAFHGVVMLLAALAARRRLNRPLPPMQVDTREVIDDPALLEERRTKFPYYLLDPQRRRALIGDRQNPVFVKERYTGMANRGTTAIRILYAIGILTVVIGAFSTVYLEVVQDGTVVATTFLLVETLLLCIAAPVFVATTFSKEREWGNWDMLRMTLLLPRQVVLGKTQAALQSLALPAAALLIGTIPLLVVGTRDSDILSGLAFGAVMMVVSVVHVTAVSLAAGAGQKRSTTAILTAYGVSLVSLLGLPLLAYGVIQYFHEAQTFEVHTRQLAAGVWFSPALVGVWASNSYPQPLATWYVQSHVAAIVLAALALTHLTIYRCSRQWNSPPESRVAMDTYHSRRKALSP